MFGRLLQQIRTNARLSQAEVAGRVETLQDWETDAGEPGRGAVAKLAAALGVSEDELNAGLAQNEQLRRGEIPSLPREKPGHR